MDRHLDPGLRHDAVLLFDVTDGNPNGDPDAGNQPRMDPETSQGQVTDVALKRKIRDYIELARPDDPRYKIYVQSGTALNALHKRAYTEQGLKPDKNKPELAKTAQQWMCNNFFDVRMFGAVMSTTGRDNGPGPGDSPQEKDDPYSCGQVTGPLQFTFARSHDPIFPMAVGITRQAVTREQDLQKERTMGDKYLVPYGLYRAHAFFSAPLAGRTGVTSEDLALVWEALVMMWDHDHSASRGLMSFCDAYVFTHDSKLGRAPARRLFDTVTIERSTDGPPRSFADYTVTAKDDLPAGVVRTRLGA
jgi:CRISPR-associated protein Csd2